MNEEEKLREIKVIAQRRYPGRSWSQLSKAEQQAVYVDHENSKGMAMDMFNTPMPQGQHVGPSRIFVNNPWNAVGAAAQKMVGGYMMGRANKSEEKGRKALADLQTRRDSLDRENDNRRSRREEESRQRWLQTLLAR